MFDATYRTPTYSFRVRTPLVDVARRLDELLAPFRFQDADVEPTFELRPVRRGGQVHVYEDGRLVLRSESSAGAFDYVLWKASVESIERACDHLVLHAGAVALGRRGVVLPGPPDSGKTTLTAGLVRAGFRYLTDEAAFLDLSRGVVDPFPRPLWMDPGTLDMFPGLHETLPSFLRGPRVSYHIAPDALRTMPAGAPCPIRFVVAPSYVRDVRTTIEPVSRAEALVLLARNSFNLANVGATGIERLAAVVRGAGCYRLVAGDLDSAVDAVSNVLNGRRPRMR